MATRRGSAIHKPGGPMHLDEHSDTPFYRQLEAQLREGIESGTYPTGSRLPSIRGLAADLGCARNTVEQAYHLLVQEGYVASRPGSGYVVQNVAYLQPDASAPSCAVLLGGSRRKARYDFTYGNLEPGTFPATGLAGHHRRHPAVGGSRRAATPTTTRLGRRACARPSRGGWSRSATSIAPPSKSSCRAARRPAPEPADPLRCRPGRRGHGRPRL